MKKASCLVVVLGIMALVMIPGMAGAEVVPIIDDYYMNCTLLDIAGGDFYTDSVKTHLVVTESSNDNINATCHSDLGELPHPSHAVIWDYDNTGSLCGINVHTPDGTPEAQYTTRNWHLVITPSGNITLTCHFKAEEVTPTVTPQ